MKNSRTVGAVAGAFVLAGLLSLNFANSAVVVEGGPGLSHLALIWAAAVVSIVLGAIAVALRSRSHD